MAHPAIQHFGETASNREREAANQLEPRSLRTWTPTQAVLARSAGIWHWTPEGKRLYDFTSGVLVANLGHNPVSWTQRFCGYMGWPTDLASDAISQDDDVPTGYFPGITMTAYNSITPLESLANRRLLASMQNCKGGERMQQVMWAASGSEAVQKAIWAAWARDKSRTSIIATRFGFHGKKGLAGAVTGSERDHERDPRVKFVSFPMHECNDIELRDRPLDVSKYRAELDALWNQYGKQLSMLITEPYLGGGGSYHPQIEYLQCLQRFCREKDIVFILDAVQANFGRTGHLYAFESYGLEPDLVVLGKGLGNGIPVAATVGRRDLFDHMDFGEGSDTWSANPLCCASVLATLDEFESTDVLGNARRSSAVIEAGLVRLKDLPFVAAVRGEAGGMVWGIEMQEWGDKSAAEWAGEFVLAAYRGDRSSPTCDGIHLLGPLAKKVVRISPPLVIAPAEAQTAVDLLYRCAASLAVPIGHPLERRSEVLV